MRRANHRNRFIVVAAIAAATVVGCASEGGPISGDPHALSPEELRLQNAEAKLSELSHKLDGMNASRGNSQVSDDLRSLRGDIEQLRHDFEDAQKQTQALDQRVQHLEGTAPPAASVPSSVPLAANAASPPPATTNALSSTAPALPPSSSSSPAPETSSSPVVAPTGSAPAPQEEAQYSASFSQLKTQHYDEAIRGFRAMLDQYPQGNYADNAWYWMGEAYYVKHDLNSSLQSFQSLLDRFPASPKVPDALLKVGLINIDLKKNEQGRAVLQRVVREFPNSKAADVARSKLKPS